MSGARAKGRGQLAGPPKGPSNRAAAAYASASPLDFQEPWRDEPEPSSQNRQHSDRQQQQWQTVAPAVSEDELPEDWEEAASVVQSSDGGWEEAAEAAFTKAAPEAASIGAAQEAAQEATEAAQEAEPEFAQEAAFTEAAQKAASSEAVQEAATTEAVAQEADAAACDDASMDEHTVKAALHKLTDMDGTQRALSDGAPAHVPQAEAARAAASPPAGSDIDEARAAAVSAPVPAICGADGATAEAVTSDDGSLEGASAAGTADGWQGLSAEEPETYGGAVDAALQSSSGGRLESATLPCEPQPASMATVAPSATSEALPNQLATSDICARPKEEEEAHFSAANECR